MPRLPHLTERGRETQRLLRDALMDVIREKGWEAVTVKDITDRTGLDRTTFYLHFKDKRELFLQVQQEFIDALLTSQPGNPGNGNVLLPIFEAVYREKDLYRILLTTHDTEIEDTLHNYVIDRLKLYFLQLAGYQAMDLHTQEMLAQSIASMVRGTVKWWIRQEEPEAPDQIARRLSRLIQRGLASFASG